MAKFLLVEHGERERKVLDSICIGALILLGNKNGSVTNCEECIDLDSNYASLEESSKRDYQGGLWIQIGCMNTPNQLIHVWGKENLHGAGSG